VRSRLDVPRYRGYQNRSLDTTNFFVEDKVKLGNLSRTKSYVHKSSGFNKKNKDLKLF